VRVTSTMNIRRRLLIALLLLIAITGISVAGYRLFGGPSVGFLQALYMAVITLGGVGYSEVVDTSRNPGLRIFNMLVVFCGVTISVYVFSVVTAFLVEGEITNFFGRRKMEKRIRELNDHYIVCGLGDTGRYVVDELQKTRSPFVVVEHQEEAINRFREHDPGTYKDTLYVLADATDEEALMNAGVDRARGVIAALGADKDNLIVTVLVRQKNPHIRIVARCTDLKFADKLKRAGADSTVSPNRIGGLRLASEILRPHAVGFLDLMLKEQARTLRIEEVQVATSAWVDKQLHELQLKQKYNLLLLAVKEQGSTYFANPPEDFALHRGTVLIVMGEMDDIRRARADTGQGLPQSATS
jgi:voltage-gated potassium channel